MAQKYYVGQRVSFDSHLCTIQYIGPVTGTQKDWLGVEWDDPSRGKHDGNHHGVRYFKCRSNSKIAASFIRPTRVADPTQSFLEAVHQKYASDSTGTKNASVAYSQIEISGKVVEEVGFDKIRQQQARLHELRVVIVDGLRIAIAQKAGRTVKDTCPKILELDLSRNLFEDYGEIMSICRELEYLRVLRLNGNRLQILAEHFASTHLEDAFKGVKDLSLDEMLITWEDICRVVAAFPAIHSLTADSNELISLHASTTLVHSTSKWTLRSLNLDYNGFSGLEDISPLVALPCLETIRLKGNHIETITCEGGTKPVFGLQLQYLDLSYNNVTNWTFVDELPDVFPGLTALRFSHNPIYERPVGEGVATAVIEEGYMITLARIASLKTLNYSSATAADRTNAEMFYLSRIGKAIAAVPEQEEHLVIKQHRRYSELCQTYGAPTVIRAGSVIDPNFLEARLIKFTFYMPARIENRQESATVISQEIPKGFDIYQVKGIVGRLFRLRPLNLRLIWETGEWDPVAGYEDEDEDSEAEDEVRHDRTAEISTAQETSAEKGGDKGRWTRREVELEDGTRQIGFCVDSIEAKVRVEIISK